LSTAESSNDHVISYIGTAIDSYYIRGPLPAANNAANPNNMSEMKYSMGDLGAGRNSVGTRIMWSSAGGAAGNLDGVNTHMTNYYGSINRDMVGHGLNHNYEGSAFFRMIATVSSYPYFRVYFSHDTLQDTDLKHMGNNFSASHNIFSVGLAGHIAIAVGHTTNQLTFTAFDIYSGATVRTTTLAVSGAFTADPQRVAISKNGVVFVADGNDIHTIGLMQHTSSATVHAIPGGGSPSYGYQLRLNDELNILTFISGTTVRHYKTDVTYNPINAGNKLNDPNCNGAGNIKELGVCEKCNSGRSLGADKLCSVSCVNTCYYCNHLNSAICTKCKVNAILRGGACECREGYYMDASGNCQQCDDLCTKCFGPARSQCTECDSTKFTFLSGNTCMCMDGRFFSGASCLGQCSNGCRRCTGGGGGNCTQCYPNTDGNLPNCNCNGGTTWNVPAGTSTVSPMVTQLSLSPELQNLQCC
jgi:hypothetical protein